MLLNLHQCDFSASRFWANAESRCLGYEIIVLRPLKPVNLLSKNAVEAMSFICFAIVFRPSATILYEIFNNVFFTVVRKQISRNTFAYVTMSFVLIMNAVL